MNTLQNLSAWSLKHYPDWLALVRIALGLFLCVKGFIFIADTEMLLEIMRNSNDRYAVLMLAQYIAYSHLIGGTFIAVGLATRISCLLQIPILFGAVVFVNAQRGFFSSGSDFMLSLVVLLLLILFAFLGSGRLSFAHYIVRKKVWR